MKTAEITDGKFRLINSLMSRALWGMERNTDYFLYFDTLDDKTFERKNCALLILVFTVEATHYTFWSKSDYFSISNSTNTQIEICYGAIP